MSYRQSFSADSGPPHSSQTMQQSYFAVEATGNTGSVLYMAPEVFLQEPYNEKADVFAFGTILYEASDLC